MLRMYHTGSSPLTRGKRRKVTLLGVGSRLIPAHAGKTLVADTAQVAGTAHPRSRGENSIDQLAGKTNEGSSPLTRGKRVFRRKLRHTDRLIPAHAGKTTCSARTKTPSRAHPRSRGENAVCFADALMSRGSSPLTRGKLDAVEELVSERRLIPAHAGKTTGRMCRSTCSTAHPRSRGENVRTAQYSPPAGGSSPLTRGKPAAPRSWGRTSRLIPAHAGKTACP